MADEKKDFIEFTEEEIAYIISSIESAPVDGYGNVSKNKAVYTTPYRKLAANITEKLGLMMEETETARAETLEARDDAKETAETLNQSFEKFKEDINERISSVYRYCGIVGSYALLPTGADVGDVYEVTAAYGGYPAGTNFAWDGNKWDALGNSFSNYYTKTQVDNGLAQVKTDFSSADARLQAEANGEVTVLELVTSADAQMVVLSGLESATCVDWGDGTIENHTDGSRKKDHTYVSIGTYKIKVYGLTEIASSFIDFVTLLRSVTISDKVIRINSMAFYNCFNLTKAIIGKSVTDIGSDAFHGMMNTAVIVVKAELVPALSANALHSSTYPVVLPSKIIVPTEAYETYKTSWPEYTTLIDCLVYQSDLAESGAEIKEIIAEERKEIDRDIKNLYAITAQGGLYTILEVEQAYTARVTANGENIVDGATAAVTKIQGSTVKSANLLPFPYFNASKTENGITWTVNSDGTITASGTATNNTVFRIATDLLFYKGSYFVTVNDSNPAANGCSVVFYKNGTYLTDVYSSMNINIDENSRLTIYLQILAGLTVNNFTFKPMLNEGTTALPYQPYFSGLKHAYIDSIKSTGKNLIPFPYGFSKYDLNGITFIVNSDGSVSANGTAMDTASTGLFVAQGTDYSDQKPIPKGTYVLSGAPENCEISMGIRKDSSSERIVYYCKAGSETVTINIENDTTRYDIQLVVRQGNTVDVTFKPMLNFGTSVEPYEPYKEDIYQLPETLELGEWDYVEPQTGVVTRVTKMITFDGTEDWSAYTSNSNHYQIVVDDNQYNVDSNNIISNLYPSIKDGYYGVPDDNNVGVLSADGNRIRFKDINYSTVEEWKAHLAELYAAGTPLIVAYQVVEPTTETIDNMPKLYTAWKNGSEMTLQGDTDNSKYGATPTVTTEYFKLTEE